MSHLDDLADMCGAAELPVTDKWQGEMRAAAAKLREKYRSDLYRTVTVAELLADVDHWWQVATTFNTQAAEVSTVTAEQKKRAQGNMLALLEARGLLRGRPAGAAVPAAELPAFVAVMVAPIEWLISVGRPVIRSAEIDQREGFPWRKALWLGGGIAAIWGLHKMFGSAAELKREVVGPRPLLAARGQAATP